MSKKISIGVAGKTGRVGRLIVAELESGHWPGLTFAEGTTSKSDPATLFDVSDVVIDFTTPESTARHVWIAAKNRKPLVIGTTGLNDAQMKEIHDAATKCPILHAANMSVGVTLLQALVAQAAARLGPEWDVEILETHHRRKIDSPSGTALALAKAANRTPFYTDREGQRPSGGIGFAVRRGGDVVGEHTVSFYGEGERIELSHTATDRALFARGALRAAQWLHGQPHGLYGMKDVLDLT